jgi:hypothetical protein
MTGLTLSVTGLYFFFVTTPFLVTIASGNVDIEGEIIVELRGACEIELEYIRESSGSGRKELLEGIKLLAS